LPYNPIKGFYDRTQHVIIQGLDLVQYYLNPILIAKEKQLLFFIFSLSQPALKLGWGLEKKTQEMDYPYFKLLTNHNDEKTRVCNADLLNITPSPIS
jgi:hypothetical protein